MSVTNGQSSTVNVKVHREIAVDDLRVAPAGTTNRPDANRPDARRLDSASEVSPPASAPATPPFAERRHDNLFVAEQVIAGIDALLEAQLNAVLHQPFFQTFEARWRGLLSLVEQYDQNSDHGLQAAVKILDVKWRELSNDLEYASEFSHSNLFRCIYDEEFGSPGGQPYGLLLGDFEIGTLPAGGSLGDLRTFRLIGDTAAAAFCPFVAQAHPSLLGLDGFGDLQRQLDLRARFEAPSMIRWRELRDAEESRFLALTLPRVLTRLPYRDDGALDHGFRFREAANGPDGGNYCWASSIWSLGTVAIRAFQESGWFASMRGTQQGQMSGGMVRGLPAADFGTDAPGVAVRVPLNFTITDDVERELAEHGFICLCPDSIGHEAAFFTLPSLRRPAQFTTAAATANASVSAMLPYVLCVSRFAHALKVIARDLIGGPEDAETLHNKLNAWINKFVVEGSTSSSEQRARFPLSAASVALEAGDQPDQFNCVLHLEPHFQFDQIVASMKLRTRLHRPR